MGYFVSFALAAFALAVLGFALAFGAAFGFTALPNHGVRSGTSLPSIRLTVSPKSTANCTEALNAALPG